MTQLAKLPLHQIILKKLDFETELERKRRPLNAKLNNHFFFDFKYSSRIAACKSTFENSAINEVKIGGGVRFHQ